MPEFDRTHHSFSIGYLEFRRTVRVLWQDKARLALLALGVVVPSLMITAFMVLFADALRDVDALPASDQFRGTVALMWLFAVFLIGQRVVSARTRIEAEPLLLTTVPARTVARGLLLSETLRLFAYLGLPLLMMTGVTVFIFGSLASLVLMPGAALLFAATAVVTGSMCGYAVAWLVATSRFVARHKTALGLVASLIGTGGYVLFLLPDIGGISQASLAWLPVGWFVDLALTGTGLTESPLRGTGVLFSSAILLLGGTSIVERVTTALWYTEPVRVDTGSAVRESTTDGDKQSKPARFDALATAIRPLLVPRIVSTPTRRVAEWALLRTKRDPNRVMFLMVPVFAIGSALLSTALQSGSIDALAAPLCAVALPWAAGSLFAMNPFGDEAAVLPVTLTAVSGKQYVRGLIVPGVVFGVPIVILVTGIAGIISPYTPAEQGGLVALSVYLTVVGATITPAIGMSLPRFSAISVGQSRDIIPPRMTAVIVHMALTVLPGGLLMCLILAPQTARAIIAGFVGALPAFLLELLADSSDGIFAAAATQFTILGDGVRTFDLVLFQAVSGGLTLLGGVFVAILLYRNAVDRFDRYALS